MSKREVRKLKDSIRTEIIEDVKGAVGRDRPIYFAVLYGSQNYNLDTEDSDYDVYAVVGLTLSEAIYQGHISKEVKYKHGSIMVKDIVSFSKQLLKSSHNALEVVFALKNPLIINMYGNAMRELGSTQGLQFEKIDQERLLKGMIKDCEANLRQVRSMQSKGIDDIKMRKASVKVLRLHYLVQAVLAGKSIEGSMRLPDEIANKWRGVKNGTIPSEEFIVEVDAIEKSLPIMEKEVFVREFKVRSDIGEAIVNLTVAIIANSGGAKDYLI